MRISRMIPIQTEASKEQSRRNAAIRIAVQQGIDDGRYYETVSELEILTLTEVKKRIAVIESKYSPTDQWDDFDRARTWCLTWRAQQLGIDRPRTLFTARRANNVL